MWTTPELAPLFLTTTPHEREDVSALDRFNVHRCPTRRVFSGTGIELVTRQATIRYLYHSATAATSNYHTTPWEDVSALERFNVHRCPKRQVFSGTALELVTRQVPIRYLYHSATAATTNQVGELCL
ncbi:uncharacterized protein TNCV_2240431 [Trichonephila clavipes]|nr:uncharacterized protein TNCV_2240431 [Trichonephila clavipes]